MERIHVFKVLLGETNFCALVDEGDVDLVSQYRWHVKRTTRGVMYARCVINGHQRFMHTLIIGSVPVDHVNLDGLDNRRQNLRPATQAQNNANRRKQADTTSQFKGVSWEERTKRWRAQIQVAGRCVSLGRFVNQLEAAGACDVAALAYFGEFARLNLAHPSLD